MVELWELDEEGKEVSEVPSFLRTILRESQEIWAKHLEKWKGRGQYQSLSDVISLSNFSSQTQHGGSNCSDSANSYFPGFHAKENQRLLTHL